MVSLGERIMDLPAAEALQLLAGTLNSTVTVTVLRVLVKRGIWRNFLSPSKQKKNLKKYFIRGRVSSASSHTVVLVRLIKFIHCPHTMSTHIWVLSIKQKDQERKHTHTHTGL